MTGVVNRDGGKTEWNEMVEFGRCSVGKMKGKWVSVGYVGGKYEYFEVYAMAAA